VTNWISFARSPQQEALHLLADNNNSNNNMLLASNNEAWSCMDSNIVLLLLVTWSSNNNTDKDKNKRPNANNKATASITKQATPRGYAFLRFPFHQQAKVLEQLDKHQQDELL
jgi:hypothetical protein